MSEVLVKSQFQLLLIKFNEMIDNNPPVKDVKEKLEKLAEIARKSSELNYRQTEAIIARCNNYINGEYGMGKKKQTFMNEHKA